MSVVTCCGLSNHCYANIMKHIYTAAKSSFKLLTQKAVKDKIEKNIEQGKQRKILKVPEKSAALNQSTVL